MILELTLLIVGLICLWGGAEVLVRYATALSRSLGISPIIVGLTVVSVGTSAPELVVSIIAAFENKIGISIGNIIGSNISNLGLILGAGAVITPLIVRASWLTREVPFMIGVTVLFTLFSFTGSRIVWWEGLVLLVFLGIFLSYVARFTLKEMNEFRELVEQDPENTENQATLRQKLIYLLYSCAGVGILILGSQLAVDSGTILADIWGISQSIIGLTLIALGTSLPELATTIVSAYRKEIDLAVGNIIGSNIFNLTLIGGVTPLIREIPIESHLLTVELPILLVLTLIIWPMMRLRWNIQRLEGFVLLASYLLFIYITVEL